MRQVSWRRSCSTFCLFVCLFVCLYKKVFAFCSYFTGNRFLGRWFSFSFNTWNISFHSTHSLHGFWWEVSCNSYSHASVGKRLSSSSLFFQHFLFVLCFIQFEPHKSRCVCLCVLSTYAAWYLLRFLNLWFGACHFFGQFLGLITSNFPSSLSPLSFPLYWNLD